MLYTEKSRPMYTCNTDPSNDRMLPNIFHTHTHSDGNKKKHAHCELFPTLKQLNFKHLPLYGRKKTPCKLNLPVRYNPIKSLYPWLPERWTELYINTAALTAHIPFISLHRNDFSSFRLQLYSLRSKILFRIKLDVYLTCIYLSASFNQRCASLNRSYFPHWRTAICYTRARYAV